MDFPLPEASALTKPYWDALQSGHLAFQRCQHCAHAWLPARAECPNCLHDTWQWTKASGRGRLVSWVVFHHAYHPAFKDRLPYNVALVELEEGPRLLTNIINPDHGTGIAIERPVELRIETEHGATIARFALS